MVVHWKNIFEQIYSEPETYSTSLSCGSQLSLHAVKWNNRKFNYKKPKACGNFFLALSSFSVNVAEELNRSDGSVGTKARNIIHAPGNFEWRAQKRATTAIYLHFFVPPEEWQKQKNNCLNSELDRWYIIHWHLAFVSTFQWMSINPVPLQRELAPHSHTPQQLSDLNGVMGAPVHRMLVFLSHALLNKPFPSPQNHLKCIQV